MITVNKETRCSNCGHQPICSLTRDFLEVQTEINNIHIGSEEDGGLMHVTDIKWLDIAVNCKHYILNLTTR